MKVSSASLLALGVSSLTGSQAWTQPGSALSKIQSASGQVDPGSSVMMRPAVNDPRMGQAVSSISLQRMTSSALFSQRDHDVPGHNPHDFSANDVASAAARAEKNDNIAAECRELIGSCKTLSYGLPSVDGDNTELSYAPFSFEDKPMTFYVLGSQIAGASRALIDAAQTGKPASVMMMSPEADTKQMYARKRLILQVKAEAVPRGSEQWNTQVGKLRARFGRIVDTLSAMPDFSMVALKPFKGRFIKGFGQAHDLVGKDLMHSKPVTGRHQASDSNAA